MEISYEQITHRVIELTRRVSLYIQGESENFEMRSVVTKSKNDFVSYVDKEAERRIVEELSKIIPGSGFIAEEGSGDDSGQHYRWVIDPLDGTTNFLHASTPYAISIALLCDDELVIGVVHEITRHETFYTWKGSPAYLNGKRIHVSDVQTVADALIATGRPHNYMERYDQLMIGMDHFNRESHGIRQSGSSATDLAYVACGRYDGRYEFNLGPWDIAAGVLLIRQAGGKVCDFYGKDDFLKNGTIIASNGLIFEELRQKIQEIYHD